MVGSFPFHCPLLLNYLSVMARLADFTRFSDGLAPKPDLFDCRKIKHSTVTGLARECQPQLQPPTTKHGISLDTTRRAVIGLGIAVLTGQTGSTISLAEEGNGLWLDGPLPVPTATNKIANEATGTRSFLRFGIYMANIGPEGSQYRLRKYAFELLGLGDLIGKDAWNYMRKYLRFKSTFMYYDFDKVISAAPVDDKESLTDLANRLFDSVEKLEDAVKKHKEPETIACYEDTTTLLKEVMTRMA